jgi:hypothetical protein
MPITFLDKYNPEQFEIIDGLNSSILDGLDNRKHEVKYFITSKMETNLR